MAEASIEWPPEDPWGDVYTYDVDEEKRNFIIYTTNEPDDLILYVTNTTDPVKAAGEVENGEFKPAEPDEEEQNG